MSNWKEVPLVDLYEISSGLSKPSKEFGFGYPFLSFKDVFNNYFIPKKIDSLVNSTENERNKCSVKYGDLFLTRTSETKEELGMSCVALKDYENATFNGFTKRLRPKNGLEIDAAYVGFYCRSPKFRADISAFSNLITRASLNNDAISRLKILLPPIFIQKNISQLLLNYNHSIENNLKRIKLLEELAQRTYEEWFVKFRINGEQLPIDENTGLPFGWRFSPINSIAEIISGYPFKSSDYINEGKFKIVTIKNVQDGYFVPETTDSLETTPPKLKSSQKLGTNDIILSLTGNVGRTCLVYGDNYLLNQRVAKIKAYDYKYQGFIYFLLRSRMTLTALENLSNGAAQQNLSPINLGNMNINIPSNKLIDNFYNISNPIINQIGKLNIQNNLLKQSRDLLLPRLMNGTIKIDEP